MWNVIIIPCVIPMSMIFLEKIWATDLTAIDQITRIIVKMLKYTAPKKEGLEYITPALPKFAVIL